MTTSAAATSTSGADRTPSGTSSSLASSTSYARTLPSRASEAARNCPKWPWPTTPNVSKRMSFGAYPPRPRAGRSLRAARLRAGRLLLRGRLPSAGLRRRALPGRGPPPLSERLGRRQHLVEHRRRGARVLRLQFVGADGAPAAAPRRDDHRAEPVDGEEEPDDEAETGHEGTEAQDPESGE